MPTALVSLVLYIHTYTRLSAVSPFRVLFHRAPSFQYWPIISSSHAWDCSSLCSVAAELSAHRPWRTSFQATKLQIRLLGPCSARGNLCGDQCLCDRPFFLSGERAANSRHHASHSSVLYRGGCSSGSHSVRRLLVVLGPLYSPFLGI